VAPRGAWRMAEDRVRNEGVRLRTGIDSYDAATWRRAAPRVEWTCVRGGFASVQQVSDGAAEAEVPAGRRHVLLFVAEGSDVAYPLAEVGGRPAGSSPAPGSVCFVPAGHDSAWVREGALRLIHVHVDPAELAAMADDGDGPPAEPDLPSLGWIRDPAITRAVGALSRAARSPAAARNAEIDAVLLGLGVHLIRAHSSLRDAPAPVARRLSEARLSRVRDFAMANLRQDIGLDDLADVACLSAAHFVRAFRDTVGEPPHRWLMRRRAEAARGMVADTRLPLGEIARACGFASQSHMTDVFRRLGLPPPGAARREGG
jgi:AraC family transcriptional regulator